MTYTCPKCGEEHIVWPTIVFTRPDLYHQLSLEEKRLATLSADTCVIPHKGQTHHFIHCTMRQLVNEHCQDLDYQLWVSVNEENFLEYGAHSNDPAYQAQYFGWLANWLPEYKNFTWIKMHLTVNKAANEKPEAFVQVVNDPNIPFVRDYFQGITKEAAQARIEKSKRP